jgi:hypothetical protein
MLISQNHNYDLGEIGTWANLLLPHITVTIILQMRHLLYTRIEVLDALRVLPLL